MKIIHTGDWHLGHQLYGFEREYDHRRMLDSLAEIIAIERPDALLICGDIFHTPNPSASAQKLFAESLVKFLDAAPGLTIIAIAGNHDSGSRHEVYRSLMLRQNVILIGTTDTSNPESHLVEIKGKGWIAPIPYTHRRNMPEEFFSTLTDAIAKRNDLRLPVVIMAHTSVTGADLTGHSVHGRFTAGGIDAVGINSFGNGYDYLALGHIHKPQTITTGSNSIARYSGTPIAISFDENFGHSVSVVILERHGEKPDVKCVATDAGRPLTTLPPEKALPFDQALELLKDYPDDIESLIRLNVLVDGFLPPEAMTQARSATDDKRCTLCTIATTRKSAETLDSTALSVQDLRETSPKELLQRYAADCGLELTDELLKMFDTAVDAVIDEKTRQ